MKRNLIILGFLMMMSFIACEKDDNKKDETKDPAFNAPFSEYTSEENKDNLEQTGTDMVGELDQLKDEQAINVAINLIDMLEDTLGEESISEEFLKPLELVASIRNGNVSPNDILISLKSTAEEPVSLMEEWSKITARYTWNFITEEFDSSGLSNAIVVEFPGLEEDISNTAVLTINNVTFYEIPDPIEDWPSDELEPELPTGMHIDLKYNSDTLVAYDFSAAYASDGMPTSINSTLTVGEFSFVLTMTHNPYSSASVTSSLKHNDDILIELHFAGNGDWSEENIENNTVNEEVEVEEIVNSGNAHIIVMNIKIAGMINAKALGDVIREVEEDDEYTEEEIDQLVEAINNYATLVVVYRDVNKKIAEIEAYKFYDSDDDDYYVDFRFIFADDSKVDAETYFEDGFEDFVNSLNDFFSELGDEYDIEIDPVEY